MLNIITIIKEEINKFLKESEEEIDYDLYYLYFETINNILSDFLEHKKMGIKEQPWVVIPFPRLKKIWEDFMRNGFVRDIRGLEVIENIVQNNIIKLYANTVLCGHTSINPDDEFEEFGFTEEDRDDFYDYIDKISDYAFSDFGGRRLGLLTLLKQLRKAKTPEEKIVIIDQILNVAHQRSDLASWFIEGGSYSLSKLSGDISNNN